MKLYQDGWTARVDMESRLNRIEGVLESVRGRIEDRGTTTLEELLAELEKDVMTATINLAIVLDGRFEEFNKEFDEYQQRSRDGEWMHSE